MESATLDERLAALIDPIREERDRLAAQESQVIAEFKRSVAELTKRKNETLDALKVDSKRINAVLSALEGERPKPVRKGPTASVSHIGQKRKNGTATGHGVTMEACAPIVQFIKKVTAEKIEKGEDPTFTQRDIFHPLELDQAKVSSAFKWFRSIEFLRKSGRTETGADLWAILDEGAYTKVLSGVANAA